MSKYNFLIHKEVEIDIDFAKVYEVVKKDNPRLEEAFGIEGLQEVFGDNITYYLNDKMGLGLPEDDDYNEAIYDDVAADFYEWMIKNNK